MNKDAMKNIFIFLFLSVLSGCNLDQDEALNSKEDYIFYAGTYTGSGSRGIYRGTIDANGYMVLEGLAAETENPSFLAMNRSRNVLLAVNETGPEGSVGSYQISGDTLIKLSGRKSGGAHPCFVDISDNGYVLTANYSSGTIGLLKIDRDGKLSELLDLKQHEGQSVTERQQGPHAHSASFMEGSTGVLSVDLGTDEVWFWDLDTAEKKLLPAKQQKLFISPGAGPRHTAFHPKEEWIYVVNELNNTVSLLQRGSETYYHKGPSVATLPEDFSGESFCADIHISSDGKFVYVSNRGHNSIAIFRVEPETGHLNLAGLSPTCGEWPRNFALTPGDKFVVVANQHSNNIVSFSRDANSGMLSAVDTIALAEPVCILF